MEYPKTTRAALLLCALAALAAGHGDGHMDMSMDHVEQTSNPTSAPNSPKHYNLYDEPNYASLEAHSGLMLAHIVFEVLAWFFILPIGKLAK